MNNARRNHITSRPAARRPWLAAALAASLAASGTVLAAPPAGGLILKQPASQLPALHQTGGFDAKVPMKHVTKVFNGNEVSTHGLATGHGNLDVPFKISMSCAAGSTVSHLAYQAPGQAKKTLIDSVTNTASYSRQLKLRPFRKQDMAAACRKALGGDWLAQASHPDKGKRVTTTLTRQIQVWGQCSNGGPKKARQYPARIKLHCEDRDASRRTKLVTSITLLR